MPICAELDAELRLWLTRYAEQVGPLRPNHFLLPRRQSVGTVHNDAGRIVGHEMTYFPEDRVRSLGRVVRPVLEQAGFPVVDHAGRSAGEGAHTLRRSGARALFDQWANHGYDNALRMVQSMLHHSSIAQTERYIGVTADRRSRDELLRGKPMFPIDNNNVVRLTV